MRELSKVIWLGVQKDLSTKWRYPFDLGGEQVHADLDHSAQRNGTIDEGNKENDADQDEQQQQEEEEQLAGRGVPANILEMLNRSFSSRSFDKSQFTKGGPHVPSNFSGRNLHPHFDDEASFSSHDAFEEAVAQAQDQYNRGEARNRGMHKVCISLIIAAAISCVLVGVGLGVSSQKRGFETNMQSNISNVGAFSGTIPSPTSTFDGKMYISCSFTTEDAIELVNPEKCYLHCAPVQCCFEMEFPTWSNALQSFVGGTTQPESTSHDECPDAFDCTDYFVCANIYQVANYDGGIEGESNEEGGIGAPPVPAVDLDDICSQDQISLLLNGMEECEEECLKGASCCQDMESSCAQSHASICKLYDGCWQSDEQYSTKAYDAGGMDPTDLDQVCSLSTLSSLDSSSVLACEEACSSRSCCFANVGTCYSDMTMEWCEEFKACRNLDSINVNGAMPPGLHPKDACVGQEMLEECRNSCEQFACCFADYGAENCGDFFQNQSCDGVEVCTSIFDDLAGE